MKVTNPFLYVAALGVFFTVYSSIAQDEQLGRDPFEEGEADELMDHQPKQLRVYTESYEISALEYAKLITTPKSNTNHDNLRDYLLEKTKKGGAKLIANHTITCRSGEKATTESIREFISPTDYEPSDGFPPVKKKNEKADIPLIFPNDPFTPIAFETRNLGHTLEVEPTLGVDPKIIDLRLAPETVKHVGDNLMVNWVFPHAKIKLSRPIFYTKRLNTGVTVNDGQFLLASTYSPEKDGKPDHTRKVLYFVRAEVLTVSEE